MPVEEDIFITIHIQGAILPADLLRRIVTGDTSLGGLKPQDYHLAEGEKLNDAINRSWNRLSGLWSHFRVASQSLPDSDLGTTLTRERWLLPLFQELGYGRLQTARAIEVKGKSFPISHSWGNTPVHLVGSRVDLDVKKAGVAGAARSSPHSLVQELLNTSEEHLWAFVSNGLILRILRDNASLVRQAYVEFDLVAMFDNQAYADFVLLWLICHQSRVESQRPEECWLERWSKDAQLHGARALEKLREGVEKAISVLGSGFLKHPANQAIKDKLRVAALSTQDYYRQILRLVYRLLFLFVAEDRDLLLAPDASEESRSRYLKYYSTSRLRRLADHLRGTRHTDLYEVLRLVTTKLGSDAGYRELGLPALNGFLFSKEALPDLESCELSNADLLNAVRALAFLSNESGRRPVDYKNLRSEELGSVYEALLELHPRLNTDAGTFELTTAAGHERKATGSYYTPESLVLCLLDSALDPVLEEACRKPNPEVAILHLKVCDPACGSGHFPIAAAHRIAKRLASIRTGDEEPAPSAMQKALRDVISHCIYGVDQNPMAVELCKVALWIESLEPGKPLSFLDHHIQCGNSLLGTTPALLKKGIPDEAFTPIEGDDKEFCKTYKKQNKEEREGIQNLPFEQPELWMQLGNLATAVMALDTIADDTVGGVRDKQRRYEEFVKSSGYLYGRLLADAWCAAFVWKKSQDPALPYPITEGIFRKIEQNPHSTPGWLKAEIERLAQEYKILHWHLAFPDVFRVPTSNESPRNGQAGWSGGFDVVVGNPPWDKIQPEEEKFFADIRPDIATAPTAKIRKELISRLPVDDVLSHSLWEKYKRNIDGICHFLKSSGTLRYAGEGNLNSYRIFTELSASLLSTGGRAGLVVQTGLATDESGKELFDHLLSDRLLLRFLDFENRQVFFTDVHQQFRFSLITIGGSKGLNTNGAAEFGWLLHSLEELRAPGRLVCLSASDLLLFNPASRTCPVFTSVRDLAVAKVIYQQGRHVCLDDNHRLGKIDFFGELFNMTRDVGYFLKEPGPTTLPLYEAKFIHQYDHRFATFNHGRVEEVGANDKASPDCFVATKSYVENSIVQSRASKRGMHSRWLAGFRSIASPTNERTAILSVFPFSGVGNSINLILGLKAVEVALLTANANAFAFDFCARQKISGSNVNIWIFKQLPAIAFEQYEQPSSWSVGSQTLRDWVLQRVLELSFTAWDLQRFAIDCGWNGPPFRWEEGRRFLIRCELDAAFFHLYGILRDDAAYILDTFPLVKQKDEETHGQYRTKRIILEIYDAMAETIRTGQPYQTRLDPLPGPPIRGLPDWPAGSLQPTNWPSHIHSPHRN